MHVRGIDNIYTSGVFSYDKHKKNFDNTFFHEATSVAYEPAAPAAVLNTALLCI